MVTLEAKSMGIRHAQKPTGNRRTIFANIQSSASRCANKPFRYEGIQYSDAMILESRGRGG